MFRPPNLAAGGACAWRLPADERGPAAARSLLHQVMAGLGLERDLIEDGKLAVSETATNALRHAHPQPVTAETADTAPELWIWARTVPAPQLVVSLFDCARHALPRPTGTDLLDEHGKGLGLVAAVTADWGTGPSRSRLSAHHTPGKTVWFALPLPFRWPGRHLRVHPGTAAQTLMLNLGKRGYTGRRSSDEEGVSVVELPGLNVWVLPEHFCWRPEPGRCVRRPLIDLQETAELLVRHLEGAPTPAP
ncbi:ATP-binding protein [Actinomadura sp. NPDC047616]|uniref:ATP-binding protein n=1 Tax=Actinomadura sp. NPDC047616 TaxID=3155914 RepID=UPI0033C09766